MYTTVDQQIQSRFNKPTNNKIFELLVIVVILISALVIGVKSFYIPVWLNNSLNFLDVGITVFFLEELLVRFFDENDKRNFSS